MANFYGQYIGFGAGGEAAPSYTNFWYGERGLFCGGWQISGARSNVIDYINIASEGDASDFGDLTGTGRRYIGGCSDASRAVFGGGAGSWSQMYDTIDYVNVASIGDATDFGDYSAGAYGSAAASNGTRGLFFLGENKATGSWLSLTEIEYVTIQSAANTNDFGDRTGTGSSNPMACSNGTKALCGGGLTHASVKLQNIDTVNMDSLGNATDFGDLSTGSYSGIGAGARERGIFHLGYISTGKVVTLEYVTISSNANAQDFGDLTTPARGGAGGTCSGTRVVVGGGVTTTNVNTIDFVVTDSLGNANDFGDLTQARYADPGGASGNAA